MYRSDERKGEGKYMRNVATHHSVAAAMWDRALSHLLGELPIPASGPFVLCDYGAADGGVSHDVIAQTIEYLQNQHDGLEICVKYEDQPEADYNSLFKLMDGNLGRTSYQETYPRVYVSAIGTSFYKRCLPNRHVHLAISTTAMHWLSKIPCKMTESICSASPECLESERQQYTQQMIQDFTTNLLHRAEEMASGAYLVVVLPQGYGHSPLLALLHKLWKRCVQTGRITQDEFYNTNFQWVCLSKDEVRSVFGEKTEVYRSGLRLLQLLEFDFSCPFREPMARGDCSPEEFGRHAAATFESFVSSSLYNGLAPTRPQAERDAIVKQLFADYAQAVAEDPYHYPLSWKNHCMVIKQTA